MAFLNLFKKEPTIEEKIKHSGFEIAECSEECDSCTTRFPKSVALQADNDSVLYGSSKPYGLHVVVPTNKNDWAHDALGESGTLPHVVSKWAESAKFPGLGENTDIKVTVSSLSSLKMETDHEYMEQKRGDLLLLPFFVWVRNVTLSNASEVLNSVVPDLIRYRDEHLAELPSSSYAEHPGVEVNVDSNRAYVFLCSHRTRDKRCGVTAPIMRREMEAHLRDLGLYRDFSDDRPHGVQVEYVNHIGGHKFAANVIIYLKASGKNIWLARCTPLNVVPIIDECIVGDGKVWPDKVRQVQKFKAVEW